jgi:hypothetical protein
MIGGAEIPMRKAFLLQARLLPLVALPMVAACGETQTTPTPAPASLTVTCDATTLSAVGQQSRCQARVTLSDSATQDQTAAAQWSSSDSTKVSASASGQIAAVAIGSADIIATVAGLTGRRTVSVSVACEFSVSPTALSFPPGGGSQAVTVNAAPDGCSPAEWTAASNNDGLTVSPSSGRGSGTVILTAAENNGASKTVTATIAGKTVPAAIAAEPPPRRRFALNLTLLEGEQLSGPYGGFVTGPDGFSCTLSGRSTNCPQLSLEEGARVELVVTLTIGAAFGRPIRTSTGCDAQTANTCVVTMNGDRAVSIAIGCEVACGFEPSNQPAAAPSAAQRTWRSRVYASSFADASAR